MKPTKKTKHSLEPITRIDTIEINMLTPCKIVRFKLCTVPKKIFSLKSALKLVYKNLIKYK
jgi:hypothetical protein